MKILSKIIIMKNRTMKDFSPVRIFKNSSSAINNIKMTVNMFWKYFIWKKSNYLKFQKKYLLPFSFVSSKVKLDVPE